MPLFEFLLEGEGKEIRRGLGWADSKEDLQAFLEESEQRAVDYRLTTEELKTADRGRLALHEQTKPYKLTKLRAVTKKGD